MARISILSLFKTWIFLANPWIFIAENPVSNRQTFLSDLVVYFYKPINKQHILSYNPHQVDTRT